MNFINEPKHIELTFIFDEKRKNKMKNRKQAYIILILIMIIAFVCTHDESWILMHKLHVFPQKQDFYQIISAIIYFMIGILIDRSSLKILYNLLNNKIIEFILSWVGKLVLIAIAYILPLCHYLLKKDSDADDAKKAIDLGKKKYKALLEEKSDMLSLYGIEALLFVTVIIISLVSTKILKILKAVIVLILDFLNLVVFIYVNYKNAKQSNFDFTRILK